jgi:pyruvate,water dikinase
MSEQPWIWTGESTDGPAVEQIGGKAWNLNRLRNAGADVPEFFAVTAATFQQVMEEQDIASAIRSLGSRADQSAVIDAAADLRAAISASELPQDLENQIRDRYECLCGPQGYVAVRSSALDEDSSEQSFAGMHDSFLFVRSIGDVLQAIRHVWASAFNERALVYRLRSGLPLTEIAVAVVVQKMINASRSGVMFTCNPGTNNVHQIVVSSLYGVGEGLVSAGLEADTYTVEKESLEFSVEIVRKREQLIVNQEQGGLTNANVPAALQEESSLSDQQVRDVARVGLQVERLFGCPQDIEFCFDDQDRLLLLQSRPVTNIEEYGPAAGDRMVWDNSNIIESYSGVTSPMTFSFIRRAYTIVYHCFSEVMGISAAKVRANQRTFENMLGLFRGRVYYNLQNWYCLIRLFPGFQYNAPFMESMMGLKEKLDMDDAPPPAGFWRRWFVELPALLRLLCRSTFNFMRIRPIVAQFEGNFREHYDRWSALDLSRLRPRELMELYYEMEDALLWNWKAPIINDFYVMIYYGLLKKLCGTWCHDESGSLQNDLICGEGGVESAEPAKMLLRLANQAQKIPELRELITTLPPMDLPRRIASDSRFSAFQREFSRYLDLYGFRCMDELKLEEHSLRDHPHLVYQVLRNYLALDNPAALDVAAMEAREQKVRREAEGKVRKSLRGVLAPLKRVAFHAVLKRARLGIKNRENMRFARTRIYGLVRELLRAFGRRLTDEGVLDDPQDVFYLTIDEVWDFVKGTSVTTNLRDLAKLRQEEFDGYRSKECPQPDERFETFGMTYHRNRFVNHKQKVMVSEDGILRGIGCSPGVVNGKVIVISDPREDVQLANEILVAERTDPGWVPLYPAVSGLLIERGSILSHSAVVAREMGIPTIVGITGLIATLENGQYVTMDGSAGTVTLCEPSTSEDSTTD